MATATQGIVRLNDYDLLEQTLDRIVARIRDQGSRRHTIATILKKIRNDFSLREVATDDVKELVEDKFTLNTPKEYLDGTAVMGVDGGVLARSLHGLDLILVRAVAVLFRYQGGGLSGSEYYPRELPTPRLISIDEPFDARELELAVGMQRQLTELRIAREALTEHEVDAVLLDGSVVPQYVDSSLRKPRLTKLYRQLVATFTGLYRECAELGTPLVGVVKDSRSSRFVNLFQRKIMPLLEDGVLTPDDLAVLKENESAMTNSRDTSLLDHLLGVGERTFAFSYSSPPVKVLEDLGEWASRAYAFYIKTVPFDRPVRVEFIDGAALPERSAEEAASLVYALSSGHDACAIPTVLIEADACARLAREELNIIQDNILGRLDPSNSIDLRRNRRPF